MFLFELQHVAKYLHVFSQHPEKKLCQSAIMNATTVLALQQFCADSGSSSGATIGELVTDLADAQVRGLMFAYLLRMILMYSNGVANVDQATITKELSFMSLGELGTMFVQEYLYKNFLGHQARVLDVYDVYRLSETTDFQSGNVNSLINNFDSYLENPERTLTRMVINEHPKWSYPELFQGQESNQDLDQDLDQEALKKNLIVDFDRVAKLMYFDRHLLQLANEVRPTWSKEAVQSLSTSIVTMIFQVEPNSKLITRENILEALDSAKEYVERLEDKLQNFYSTPEVANTNADFCTLFVIGEPEEHPVEMRKSSCPMGFSD